MLEAVYRPTVMTVRPTGTLSDTVYDDWMKCTEGEAAALSLMVRTALAGLAREALVGTKKVS